MARKRGGSFPYDDEMPTHHAAPARSGAGARSTAALLGQFLSRPHVIGAVSPSSRHLAERMVEDLDLANARAVLEYGPGTGVFTDAIVPRLGQETRFVAIELNPVMARVVGERHPRVRLRNDSVEHARRICDEEGIDRVDAIISGLPWASFGAELQRRILTGVTEVLRPGGVLVTFGYHVGTWLPAGRRFYASLPGYFSKIERSGLVWRNVPPAFVVRCTR